MHPDFDLVVTTASDSMTAELRLLDASGQIGYQSLDIRRIPAATVQGLFNLREFVRVYAARPGEKGRSPQELLADLGVSVAREVLGPEIFGRLAESDSPRTMRVQLPIAQTNHLAAALARVPWEIARESAQDQTLAERNLIVRAVVGAEPKAKTLTLEKDEALRVLFIFAEAPGSRPLAARQEREQLLDLFEREVYPRRRVEADILAHGVTRERLIGLITDRHGFHVVHWSGHGHQNLLQLASVDGQPDRLSGEELVKLLNDAGGFKPQLFFLSACHSGDVLRIRDWSAFAALADGQGPETKEALPAAADVLDRQLTDRPGYTGTAHALLRAGIPSVVAMRYAVGDDYARDLAVDFYRATLAATNPPSVAEALNLARKRLRTAEASSKTLNYDACDHATPVLYGLADPELPLPKGKSAYKSKPDPRLGTKIRELDIREHPHFVGRTWELASLGAHFIGYQKSANVAPIALVQGIGGMGKTALVAEALDLWQSQFDWVLLFQAKPNPLVFDQTLREIHNLLHAELKTYHDYVLENPADAIWRPPDDEFRGEARLQRLRENLLRAMQDEAILLVLDNFETQLQADASGDAGWSCTDPAWDQLLALLATELRGTASRVLITCRRPLAALAPGQHHRLVLGPLPSGEAALYLRSVPHLRALLFSSDPAERKLAQRLFTASRFHPLLLDRLARLVAGGPALRKELEEALQALERARGFTKLPELFNARSVGGASAAELDYLRDALESSIDLLLHHAGPDARRLLWIIALANEPVTRGLLEIVWSGETVAQEQRRRLETLLANKEHLPAELRAKLDELPADIRDRILSVPSAPPSVDPAPFLARLTAVGLVSVERDSPADDNPEYTCHELVRERILAWIAAHPEELQGRDETSVRVAYAERLSAALEDLLHRDATAALEAGRRAIVYWVQARAYDRLSTVASTFVTMTSDVRVLNAVLPHLEAAAQSAPPGKERWRCLSNLADALGSGDRWDEAMVYYEQALAEASAADAWADVAVISGNCANILRDIGDLDGCRAKRIESAAAHRRAGSPEVDVIGSELEVFRVEVMQGHAREVLPEVEKRIERIDGWFRRTWDEGETVPEAPDAEFLARAMTSALDIARQAYFALRDWSPALEHVERILQIKRKIGRTPRAMEGDRMNRASALLRLRRYAEAQSELEALLEAADGDPHQSSRILTTLADLFDEKGDIVQALELERRSLAICEQIADPRDRAASHNNLAIYLSKIGTPEALAEAAYQRLAALVYPLVVGMALDVYLSNYQRDFRWSKKVGVAFAPPTLAALLAQPAFRPLKLWLDEREENLTELQAKLDGFFANVRATTD